MGWYSLQCNCNLDEHTRFVLHSIVELCSSFHAKPEAGQTKGVTFGTTCNDRDFRKESEALNHSGRLAMEATSNNDTSMVHWHVIDMSPGKNAMQVSQREGAEELP